MALHKVFVYGTLKCGEPNYHWLTDKSKGTAKYICKAETVKSYPLIIGTKYNIPFLLDSPGCGNAWLRQNGVSPPENATKDELQRLCHMNQSHLQRYVVDEILRKEGHTVRRLPPYHSFLNAIELVWSVAKQHYNKTVASRSGHGLHRARAVWKESLDQNVIGEVYEVDQPMLEQLDILEDHPNFYVRRIEDVRVMDNKGLVINCWIYFLQNFKPGMLKQEHFKEYSSSGPHGLKYLERYLRDPSFNIIQDVQSD